MILRSTLSFETSPPPYESMNTVRNFEDGTDEEMSLSGYWKLRDGSTRRLGGNRRAQMEPVPAVSLIGGG